MKRRKIIVLGLAVAFILAASGAAQFLKVKLPETILPEEAIQAILNEVSGQIPFNNEVMMSGVNLLRTEEEFNTFFHEAKYLAQKLKEYGLDEVRLENVGKDSGRGGWWIRESADLWMVQPELRRLSRLEENPALVARMCDSGEWEGELVYLDMRDRPKIKDMDLTGKIVLTPEYAGSLKDVFTKGALGIVSYQSPAKSFYDPYQVGFDMRMDKAFVERNAFVFKIWPQLGEELKGMLNSPFGMQKVILKASAKGKTMPFKMDAVFAEIKGTNPDLRGFMFTAHLFERPAKQGANDNISGCVTLAEIARTITRLIAEGKIARPERSIYFLMSEEGSGTNAFFQKYSEMADKIFGVINMDMVGENLDDNFGFFGIEIPPYFKTSFVQSVVKQFGRYVSEGNRELHSHRVQESYVKFPQPILEKNGSKQAFKFLVNNYDGGSDHGCFIDTDLDIPALSFNVWPDLWYHTDRDRPDKTDPTQLKRVAFIGAATALAVCSGHEDVLRNLITTTYNDRLGFVQKTFSGCTEMLSGLRSDDGGEAYKKNENNLNQAFVVGRMALNKIHELTKGKKSVDKHLGNLIQGMTGFEALQTGQLKKFYESTAELNGYKAKYLKPTVVEKKLDKMTAEKIKPVKIGDRLPYNKISDALIKDPEIGTRYYQDFGFFYPLNMFLAVNGTRTLGEIRNMLNFEFQYVSEDDFFKAAKALEKAKMIKIINN